MQAATVSLGLIGAGTNNARISGMLRNLSSYYYKDPNLLFCVRLSVQNVAVLQSSDSCSEIASRSEPSPLQVRIAQGLVHMGKGLLTVNPYHSDRFLLSKYVSRSSSE